MVSQTIKRHLSPSLSHGYYVHERRKETLHDHGHLKGDWLYAQKLELDIGYLSIYYSTQKESIKVSGLQAITLKSNVVKIVR